MSANNWAICPKCKKVETAKQEAATKKLKADYGKVSIEEFRERQAELDEPFMPANNLREDWELGMDAGGEFMVKYSCACTKCGFSFEYEDSRPTGL